ncbi:uncharacterized protein FPRN_00524 [Fusarium proliferatum]|nr:uncharacterized protein FPRN_00524 [Fusarium proliferatum]
MLIYPIAGNPP